MTIRNLDAMLMPHSVALIGATSRPGSVGLTIAKNLLAGGFSGPIAFVNPHHATILDKPCYAGLGGLPWVPDLAVIATPPATIPGLIGELSARGGRAAVVITGGLEPDVKRRMLEAARPKLMRILGPNCIGLMLPQLGLDASFSHRPALTGDIAFLSQSGALVTAVIDWASARSIGFSHVVSLGDMADVDFGDMLDFLAGDTRSRAILLYMEAVTNAPKFLSAARRAARVKPVIVIKSGRHAGAARAAVSHTGRLAGNDAAYDAAFRRAGVLRVMHLSELFEAAEILARGQQATGDRLMILTNGGGAGVLAADHVADYGGTLAELSPDTHARLDRLLPPAWSKGNPVDVIGDASPDRYAAALEALLSDATCDAVLAINCPTALASSTAIAEQVISTYRGSKSKKPLITNWLGDGAALPARRAFEAARIPTFETPGAAVCGFMQLVRYARAQDELMRTPPAMPPDSQPDKQAASAVIASALQSGRTMLSQSEGTQILEAYGIPVASTLTASSPDDAAEAAKRLLSQNDAVVLKISSAQISHKSDVGGVQLGLTSADAVREAAITMLARISAARPDARIDGFTISAMIRRPGSHELILGMTVDPTFGPLVMVGAGGTSVEVVADTAVALPPLDLVLARDLIGQTRISRLLAGYRDRKPANREAVAQTLVRLSAMTCVHSEIYEIDINPLLVDEAGVIALDARFRIASPGDVRAPLAIKPYPSQWQKHIELAEIGRVLLRPIRPEDEVLYDAFLAHVTAEDLRLRLFAPQKSLTHKFLARLTQIDYAREMAFVAIDDRSDALLGVVRFTADPDYQAGEYAVIVRSDLKGCGLGWQLMRQIIDYAAATGLSELFGHVLAENTTMLKMCRELGFSVELEPDNMSVRLVRIKLRQGNSKSASD
jgi:acetyltransferase